MSLLILILLPLLTGLVITILPLKGIKRLSIVAQFALLIITSKNLYHVLSTNTFIRVRLTDTGLLGIGLISDNISSIFALLTTFLFFVFGIYIWNDEKLDALFHFLFLAVEGTILLIFLSTDFFNLFVLIEVSTIICGILMMYLKEKRAVYDGLVYIMINTTGILFFLMGIGLLYKIFGNLDLMEITREIRKVNRQQIALAFAFMMAGISVKAAIFPVYLWLPKAHGTPGAPSVVSAMLSGIYIKSTLYVLIRCVFVFEWIVPMKNLLIVLGLITAITGIILAVLSKDMKLILAYHTISQIGLIVVGLSGTYFSKTGALLHIVNHALFKALLFLAVGEIIHLYHSRKVTEIKGILKSTPIVGIALLTGILGITGAPLFNGSVSKYLISTGYQTGIMRGWLELINIGTTLSFVKLGWVLIGEKRKVSLPTWNINIALIIGSIAVFLTGIFGFQIQEIFSNKPYALTMGGLMEKAVYWILYVSIAVFLYLKILPKFKVYRSGFVLDLSFNTMIFMILVSFMTYFTYVLIV